VALLPGIVALVVPTLATPIPSCDCKVHMQRTTTLQMGFFDDLKKGFENEPELAKSRQAKKDTPAYIKKKLEERKRYEERVGAKKAKDEGGSPMDELLKGWKW